MNSFNFHESPILFTPIFQVETDEEQGLKSRQSVCRLQPLCGTAWRSRTSGELTGVTSGWETGSVLHEATGRFFPSGNLRRPKFLISFPDKLAEDVRRSTETISFSPGLLTLPLSRPMAGGRIIPHGAHFPLSFHFDLCKEQAKAVLRKHVWEGGT